MRIKLLSPEWSGGELGSHKISYVLTLSLLTSLTSILRKSNNQHEHKLPSECTHQELLFTQIDKTFHK